LPSLCPSKAYDTASQGPFPCQPLPSEAR